MASQQLPASWQASVGESHVPTVSPSTTQVQVTPVVASPPQPMARVFPSLHGPVQPQRPRGPPHPKSHVKEPVEAELVEPEPPAPPAPLPALPPTGSKATFPPQLQVRRTTQPTRSTRNLIGSFSRARRP